MLDALPTTRLDAAQHDAISSLDSRCAPCCGNGATRWCAVYTHSQAEKWAHENLTRLGFDAFLPTMVVSRRDRVVRSMRRTVELPLFSRYLFVAHDNPTFWRPIREAPGVASVVTCAGQVQYASAGAVEALQATQHVRRLPVADRPSWAPGMPVAVSGGAACGFKGVIVEVRGDRATVMLMMLGALRRVDIGLDSLVAPVAD